MFDVQASMFNVVLTLLLFVLALPPAVQADDYAYETNNGTSSFTDTNAAALAPWFYRGGVSWQKPEYRRIENGTGARHGSLTLA